MEKSKSSTDVKIEEIEAIARKAGAAILEIYDTKNAEDWNVTAKADDSPLTEADRAANKVICDFLRAEYDYPIISEENKEIPYEERRHYERFWLVDPLDGTKEFIKRNGEFTVNIALIENGYPVLGVVFAPVLDEAYCAATGEGAWMEKAGEKYFLAASEFSEKDEGLSIVCSRSHLNKETEDFISKYNNPEAVSMGSSLKFMLVAKGEAQLYPRLAPTMEWDTGAAQAIVEEAGGEVLNHETGERLRYNKENLLNPHFVVYGNRIK
ncbi:MAG: 3'(2'),5'-bisphosphate nucleotidase CysQ [Bacteroidia bacterium]